MHPAAAAAVELAKFSILKRKLVICLNRKYLNCLSSQLATRAAYESRILSARVYLAVCVLLAHSYWPAGMCVCGLLAIY